MGWSRGVNSEGREIGYAIEAVCEHDGCNEKIDLGLAYCCGDLEGVEGQRGCGHYFCGAHMFFGSFDGQRCGPCAEKAAGPDCEECGDDADFRAAAKDGKLRALCQFCAKTLGATEVLPL